MPTLPRKYEITYRLLKGNSPQQRTIIQASDPGAARRIFEQQNTGCAIVGSPRELRQTSGQAITLEGFDE
jgi:hypothetical protein